MTTTPASPAAALAVAQSQSSLDTVLNTIEHGTEILQEVMPEVAGVGGLVPGATVYIQLVGLALPYVQNAIKLIEQNEGKNPFEAFKAWVQHNSLGQPNSPTLSLTKNADGSFGPATGN